LPLFCYVGFVFALVSCVASIKQTFAIAAFALALEDRWRGTKTAPTANHRGMGAIATAGGKEEKGGRILVPRLVMNIKVTCLVNNGMQRDEPRCRMRLTIFRMACNSECCRVRLTKRRQYRKKPPLNGLPIAVVPRFPLRPFVGATDQSPGVVPASRRATELEGRRLSDSWRGEAQR
jgi:hypothetical protein